MNLVIRVSAHCVFTSCQPPQTPDSWISEEPKEESEEEEMEFVIIRDVTPTSEWDAKSEKAPSIPSPEPPPESIKSEEVGHMIKFEVQVQVHTRENQS